MKMRLNDRQFGPSSVILSRLDRQEKLSVFKGFGWFWKMAGIMLAITILISILWYGAIAALVYKGAEAVDNHGGVKGVTERLWYGKDGPK